MKELDLIPCKVNNFAIIKYSENGVIDLGLPYYPAHIVDITDNYIEIADGAKYCRKTGVYIGENDVYRNGEKIAVITQSYTDDTPLYFVEDPTIFWENYRKQK